MASVRGDQVVGRVKFALSASYAPSSDSASYATSASYALTASYALNGGGGGSTTPGGSNTQIQYNNSNAFGGVPTLTYDGTLRGTGSFSGSFAGTLIGTSSYALTASYAINGGGGSTSPGGSNTQIQFNGNGTFSGSRNFTFNSASNTLTLTGSFNASGSNTFIGTQIVTGSLSTSGSNTLVGNTVLSGSINISGSSTIRGTTTMTGSLSITGSTTQIGSNNLFGNTTLSGSIVISGSAATPSVQIYGNTTHNGYIRFDPVTTNIDSSISASYIYVSGSTQDLYFTQNGSGYGNTTRLRWLEGGALYTGLLRGGILSSTPGSTTFNISSGSGLLVTMNASTGSEPYPTVQYISWPNFTSQPLQYSASAKITYVGISSANTVIQQTFPWGTNDINQWDNSLSLGVVLHLSGSVSTGVFNAPQISYGGQQKTDDFFRAFGPLKISGHTLQASGSTLSITKLAGTSYREGANYVINANHPSTVVENSINVSKIYRYHISGSTPVIDTGVANAGYTVIDPTKYYNTATGLLDTVNGGQYSLQRVFWVPNSPTNAFLVYYGNAKYNSLVDAVNAQYLEPFTEAPNTAQNAIFLGYIAVNGGATSLTTAADASIIQAGLFRNVDGIGSGGTNFVSTTLAGLADVSLTNITKGDLLVYGAAGDSQWNNAKQLTGSYGLTGSLTVTQNISASSFTGSLFGTASLSTSASYALTASFLSGTVTSASYALTASYFSGIFGNNFTASFTTQSTWTVNHNLGNRNVLVQAYDSNYQQIIPQTVTQTDANTATIAFPTNESGFAVVSLGGSYNLSTASFSNQASTASYVNTLNQNVTISGVTTLGNGTFTKAGSATGDVLLDNNSTDTPGVLFYYANNSNYGVDSWSGSFDVLSGQLFRVTNKLNETGGTVKMAIDTTGNVVFTGFVKPSAWRAGQVINDIMLSNTEVTISTTTIATSSSDTDFLTYSYTPLSSTSYLVIHYHLANYDFSGGTGNDSYISRIKVDGGEITYSTQSTVNGNRSGVLFPLTGRYTNSNTTAKSIVVACRRNSADDNITITNSSTSMWLRITEIAR
jgi:hypothetical protein